MKRIFLGATVIIIGFITTFFIAVKKSGEVFIEANFYNILEQLNSPYKWEKWNSSIKKAYNNDSIRCRITNDPSNGSFTIEIPEHTFYVKKITPLTYEVQEKIHGVPTVYGLTVVSTTLPNKTNIITTERMSLFNYIIGNNRKKPDVITANNLKAFLENPTAYYGYTIKIANIIDTNVVVTKKIVATKERQQQLRDIYYKLSIFIHANNLIVIQPKIASFKIITKDSTEIMAGIPVNKTVSPKGDIDCLKMPKGRILVGEYEGSYNKRTSLSNAMEKYIRDHTMVNVAVPYEKYLNDSVPATDTSFVRLRMYYPIL